MGADYISLSVRLYLYVYVCVCVLVCLCMYLWLLVYMCMYLLTFNSTIVFIQLHILYLLAKLTPPTLWYSKK